MAVRVATYSAAKENRWHTDRSASMDRSVHIEAQTADRVKAPAREKVMTTVVTAVYSLSRGRVGTHWLKLIRHANNRGPSGVYRGCHARSELLQIRYPLDRLSLSPSISRQKSRA